jgi:hypothetical protein
MAVFSSTQKTAGWARVSSLVRHVPLVVLRISPLKGAVR